MLFMRQLTNTLSVLEYNEKIIFPQYSETCQKRPPLVSRESGFQERWSFPTPGCYWHMRKTQKSEFLSYIKYVQRENTRHEKLENQQIC